MRLSQQKLDKLFKLYDDLHATQKLLDENIKTAQDQHGEDTMEVKRDGKKQLFKQKFLWEEVRLLGARNNQAADILSQKYPQVWDFFDAEQKQIANIKKYELKLFGFDHKQMSINNYVKLTQALIKLEVKVLKNKPNWFKIWLAKLNKKK